MHKYTVLFLILLIISCGKSANDSDDESEREEALLDGIYSAVLIPVNPRISKNIHGEAKIEKFGDDFSVRVSIKGAPPGNFRQHLQTGSTCPRIEHDSNRDGYIDSFEAREVSGNVIVPLDGDLSSQSAGSDFLLKGNYSYNHSTSYALMLSDLHLSDDVINDAIIKLKERDLFLERKVVIVYSTRRGFSPSVQGDAPIACGLLTRISNRTERDEWGDAPSEPPSETPGPRPPSRRPRPDPDPDRDPAPLPVPPEPEEQNSGWWSRWRDRWERWRDRVSDWWNGRDDEQTVTD